MSISSSVNIKNENGFTLIEVIVVIVVLSILAVLGGKFVVEATDSYQATQARSRLVNTGRQAIERMSRQLRGALPYSVRLTNSNTCIEFMPIASGGNYLGYLPGGIYAGYVPDAANGIGGKSSISVSPHTIDFGSAQFVSIGAMSWDELYGTSPVSRAALSSRTASVLNLAAPMVWQRNSISKRFYLLDNPQAFCVVANQLRFYPGQDVTSTGVNLSSSFQLLAENVTASTPFTLTSGSENRNTIVQFNILFDVRIRTRIGNSVGSGTESISFNNSVMIRNVP